MEKRNVIGSTSRCMVSKRDLIEAIMNTFPDDEVGYDGKIAYITTTKMTDGTVMQSVLFGKVLEL